MLDEEMPVTAPAPLTVAVPERRPNLVLAAAIATVLGVSPYALAFDPSDTLEEVVVTANRREQNVLDVPYNISAVSGEALQAAEITSLTDIARLVPGIN